MGESDNSNNSNSTTINITYETIFELLRREKNRDELQKLNETFYADIAAYLEEKNKVFSPQAEDMFSDAEREKTIKQISNTKRMITELFERREKKIIILALNKIRTTSSITDTTSMLSDEKDFFYRMTDIFGEYRNIVLNRMVNEKQTTYVPLSQIPRPVYPSREEKKDVPQAPKPAAQEQKAPPPQATPVKRTKMIRILSQVPKFMGKELEVYGPFNPDDMASLPSEIAEILIRKGRAEEIHME